VINRLSNEDRKRISKAKQNWMQFESVDLAKYRGLKKQSKFAIPAIETASLKEAINPDRQRPDDSRQ